MHDRRNTIELAAVALLFLGIAAFTVIGFAHWWLPPAASEHGVRVDGVIRYLLLTTGTVLGVGSLVFVGFLWRYGRGRETAPPRAGPRAEYWWSLLPVLGMALIAEAGVALKGLPVWEMVYGEPPANALAVDVTAKQFEWYVRYPGGDGIFGRTDPTLVDARRNPIGLDPDDPASRDDVVSRNALHVPVGRPVALRLRSRDVLHSFSVPAFRVKQDIVPGVVMRTVFVPTREGRFEIGCAELCGMGHYRMRGTVVVESEEEFRAWLAARGDRNGGEDDR